MNRYKFLLASCLLSFLLYSFIDYSEMAQNKPYEVVVFENEIINFANQKQKIQFVADDFGQMGNGRIILRKIQIPNFERTVKIKATIRLQSNGDRWDKSGSCFILPADTNSINIFQAAQGRCTLPETGEEIEQLQGIIPGKNFKPTIELMRFMTPFGVGHYSGDSTSNRLPVYIPKWENEVVYTEDISDLSSVFKNEIWVGIWIDTWTKEGYKVSLTLTFDESNLECDKQKTTHVEPLINTVAYFNPKKNADIFARKNIEVKVRIPENATNVRLKYITTGHGGHSGGDEFTKKRNILYLNDKEILSFIPWRDDCAAFRRFNPTSGVWLVKDTASYYDPEAKKYLKKEIEERLASSDLSRSNWCPGSGVHPVVVELPTIKSGDNIIRFSIPEAQKREEKKHNHWLISAYLVWD